MAAPKRRPRAPKPRNPFPFEIELARLLGAGEAAEVAEAHVRRSYQPEDDTLILSLKTNPLWRQDALRDEDVPGGLRGLWRYEADDEAQLRIGEAAMARRTLEELAWRRAHQTLKDYADAEVRRYGSVRAFASHLVDLAPGARHKGESEPAARTRQVKAQIRKVQEWTQIYGKKGQPVNKKFPGEPKYLLPTRDNATRIAAARGDPRRWAVRVLRTTAPTLGVFGWWRSLSGTEEFPKLNTTGENNPDPAILVIEQDGRDFAQTVEDAQHDQLLAVVYQLKVTLRHFEARVKAGLNAQEGNV